MNMDPFSIVIGAILLILVLLFIEILPFLLKLGLVVVVVLLVLYFAFGVTISDIVFYAKEVAVLVI